MRQNLRCLTLVDNVHDAATCVSCTVCAATLRADIRPCVPPVVTLLMLTSVKDRVPRWMQKQRDKFVKVRPRTTIKRTPSLALHAMCLSIDLTVRPRLYSAQMSCRACEACVAGCVRAATAATSHCWARGGRGNRLCSCFSVQRAACLKELSSSRAHAISKPLWPTPEASRLRTRWVKC